MKPEMMEKTKPPCHRCDRKNNCIILRDTPYLALPGCPYYIPRLTKHRLLMSEAIGRRLGHDEFVHHLNGDPSDNRIENLFLCSPKEHTYLHRIMKRGKSRADAIQVIMNRRAAAERRRGKPQPRKSGASVPKSMTPINKPKQARPCVVHGSRS
jgi:hypothetical protein